MKISNFILSLPLIAASSVMSQQKPNILWVTIEDTSPQFIGCYGNKDARTPVIDKLAAEGVRFTNAFSTGTVCSPSRSAIITGVKTYQMGTGNHRSNYPIPSEIKGFPYYMQQAGYYTTNNAKTDYNVGNVGQFTKQAWDECSKTAGWWNRKPGQPFFAVFNFENSHQSRTMTESYDWYRKNVFDNLSPKEQISDNAFEMPPFYLNSPEMRKQFARVYNSIKLTDNNIGDLLKRLDADKLTDSTIIVFYADHGEGMPRGKTNGINFGYRVPFIIWFPEMYKNLSPWGVGGVVTDELVDFEDLAPTVIALAGGKVPDYMKGRKLLGKQRSEPATHLVLSADRSDNGIDMVRSVTNGRYMYSRNFLPFMPEARYIRYMEIGEIKQQMRKDLADHKLNELQAGLFNERPAEFLFDIANDIWETNNLAADPKYASVLKTMRKQLDDEVLASRDVMFLPEYQIGLLSENTTAYEYRLDDKKYPIKEIYDAAGLSGFRTKDVAKKQVQLLKSTNDIVRFWAIVGLRSQNAATQTTCKKAIEKAMITASAIAYDTFGSGSAKENLIKFIGSDNNDLALMTVNYLLYVGDKKPFVDAINLAHDNKNNGYNVRAACYDFLGSLGLVENNSENKD